MISNQSLSITVNSDIFARILISRIALKDIFETLTDIHVFATLTIRN